VTLHDAKVINTYEIMYLRV